MSNAIEAAMEAFAYVAHDLTPEQYRENVAAATYPAAKRALDKSRAAMRAAIAAYQAKGGEVDQSDLTGKARAELHTFERISRATALALIEAIETRAPTFPVGGWPVEPIRGDDGGAVHKPDGIGVKGLESVVVVKPLEWDGDFAHTPFGLFYHVNHATGVPGLVVLEKNEGSSVLKSAWNTVDEAKAAAQADYEARIRSALTSPASEERDSVIEVTDAMVEDGAVAIDALWSEGQDRGPAFAETEREYQAHCRSTARAALIAALRMEGK